MSASSVPVTNTNQAGVFCHFAEGCIFITLKKSGPTEKQLSFSMHLLALSGLTLEDACVIGMEDVVCVFIQSRTRGDYADLIAFLMKVQGSK